MGERKWQVKASALIAATLPFLFGFCESFMLVTFIDTVLAQSEGKRGRNGIKEQEEKPKKEEKRAKERNTKENKFR